MAIKMHLPFRASGLPVSERLSQSSRVSRDAGGGSLQEDAPVRRTLAED